MPEHVRGGPFESSKNFDEPQFLRTSVYPNARTPHMINTAGRARIEYRNRMNSIVRCDYRPLLLDRLRINGECRLRLSQRLYRHRLRARWRYMPRRAGEARVPIPTHLAAQAHFS